MDINECRNLIKAGHYHEVLSWFHKKPAQNADELEICAMANALIGDIAIALQLQTEAFKKSNEDWRYARNLGIFAAQIGDHDTALDSWLLCLKNDPLKVPYLNNIVLAALKTHKVQITFDHFLSLEHILQNEPEYHRGVSKLASHLEKNGQLIKSFCALEKLETLKPDEQFSYALLMRDHGELEKTVQLLEQLTNNHPDHIDAQFELAQHYLRNENFDQGWEKFEWRLKRPTAPKWQIAPEYQHNMPIKDKNFLFYAEQGAGDVLHFAHYLFELIEKGVNFELMCHAPLVPFFKSKGIKAHPLNAHPKGFDYQCPLLSIPYRFDIKKHLDFGKRSPVVNRYPRKIGLCWSGSPNFANNHLRTPPHDLFKILEIFTDIRWFNLLPQSDHASCPLSIAKDILPDEPTYLDSLELMDQMDLIISVDTSVAHLAAYSNTPTWLLLHNPPDWRWFYDTKHSKLYPSHHIFRQITPEDWTDVFKNLEQALLDLKTVS
jgi:tetratricopeptide (TPR) repeat protein